MVGPEAGAAVATGPARQGGRMGQSAAGTAHSWRRSDRAGLAAWLQPPGRLAAAELSCALAAELPPPSPSRLACPWPRAQKCEDRFAKSKMVHSIMRHVAETTGHNLEQLYAEVAWPLYRMYGHAYNAFATMITGGAGGWGCGGGAHRCGMPQGLVAGAPALPRRGTSSLAGPVQHAAGMPAAWRCSRRGGSRRAPLGCGVDWGWLPPCVLCAQMRRRRLCSSASSRRCTAATSPRC